MQNTPFFSIITPVYKGLDFLDSCTACVLGQTFADFEYLLIDDGSPDDSGKRCDQLAKTDARLRVIHQKNGGISNARNAGIRAARGKYLLFLDQDDQISLHLMQAIYDCLARYGTQDLVSWRFCTQADKLRTQPPIVTMEVDGPSLAVLYESGTFHNIWVKTFQLDFVRRHGIQFDETNRDGTEDFPFVCAYYRAWFAQHPDAVVHLFQDTLYYYKMDNDASVSKWLHPYRVGHLDDYAALMQDMDTVYRAPLLSQGALYGQCLATLAYGVYSTPRGKRAQLRRDLFQNPKFTRIITTLQQNRMFSFFYPAFRLKSSAAVSFLYRHHSKRDWVYSVLNRVFCTVYAGWHMS